MEKDLHRFFGTRVFCTFVLFCLIASGSFAKPDPRRTQLEKDLQEVQQAIQDSRKASGEKLKELWAEQRKLEREDPDVAEIRDNMREHEKALAALRLQLKEKLASMDGPARLDEERMAVTRELQALIQREQLIKNEIRAFDAVPDSGSEPGAERSSDQRE